MDLLPSLVTEGTAVEMLHTLLDLPGLSATLVLQLRFIEKKTQQEHMQRWMFTRLTVSYPSARCRSMSLPISESSSRCQLSLDAFRNPAFRGLFLFLLRAETGSGSDRLKICYFMQR